MTTRLYWQARRAGQSLILALDDGTEVEVGIVRRTPRGFDAMAKTNTYDPGRAQRGFATIEEAKAFVESFHPWDLFGGDLDMPVEPEVHPLSTITSEQADESGQAAQVAEVLTPAAAESTDVASADTSEPTKSSRPSAEVGQPRKGWWQFWRRV